MLYECFQAFELFAKGSFDDFEILNEFWGWFFDDTSDTFVVGFKHVKYFFRCIDQDHRRNPQTLFCIVIRVFKICKQ